MALMKIMAKHHGREDPLASPLNVTSPTAVTQRTLLSTQTRLRSEQGTSEVAHRTSRGGGMGKDRRAIDAVWCRAAPLAQWHCRSQAAGRGQEGQKPHSRVAGSQCG